MFVCSGEHENSASLRTEKSPVECEAIAVVAVHFGPRILEPEWFKQVQHLGQLRNQHTVLVHHQKLHTPHRQRFITERNTAGVQQTPNKRVIQSTMEGEGDRRIALDSE